MRAVVQRVTYSNVKVDGNIVGEINRGFNVLIGISKEDISYVCSIFDDLSEHFQSKELIECMEKNAKRTGFDCSVDIECAIEMLKKN